MYSKFKTEKIGGYCQTYQLFFFFLKPLGHKERQPDLCLELQKYLCTYTLSLWEFMELKIFFPPLPKL